MVAADGVPGRSEALHTLVAELRRYEHLLRETFSAGASVQIALAAAQVDQNLSLVAGHQIYAPIAAANQGVSSAITSTAHTHQLLEALGRRLGIDITGFGVENKEPTGAISADVTAALRSAA